MATGFFAVDMAAPANRPSRMVGLNNSILSLLSSNKPAVVVIECRHDKGGSGYPVTVYGVMVFFGSEKAPLVSDDITLLSISLHLISIGQRDYI